MRAVLKYLQDRLKSIGPEPLQDNARNCFPLGVVLVLAALGSVIIAERLLLPIHPINPDPGAYAVISHEVFQGRFLYVDIWDHKPPAIFVVYGIADLLLGRSAWSVFLLKVATDLLILPLAYMAGFAVSRSRVAGIAAAGLWTITAGSFPALAGRDANTEVFLTACLFPAFTLLVLEREPRRSFSRLLLVGILFAIGSAFKPVFVAYAAALSAVYLLMEWRAEPNLRSTIRSGFLLAAPGVVIWAGLFAYFGITGRFTVFYKSIIAYNAYYSGNLIANLTAPLRREAEIFIDPSQILVIPMVIGLTITFLFHRRRAFLLATMIVATWTALALPGRFPVHYYQLWLPALIIGTSWGIGLLAEVRIRSVQLAGYVLGSLIIIAAATLQMRDLRSAAVGDWTAFANRASIRGQAATETIENLLQPGETFFLWGNTPNLYLITGRRPPAAILFEQHLSGGPMAEELTIRVRQDLEQARPELLVHETKRSAVPKWIQSDYLESPIYRDEGAYTIYARRDGRIAYELGLSSKNQVGTTP